MATNTRHSCKHTQWHILLLFHDSTCFKVQYMWFGYQSLSNTNWKVASPPFEKDGLANSNQSFRWLIDVTALLPSIIPASAFKLTINWTYVWPSLVTYVAQSWNELVLIDNLTALPALDFRANPTRVLLAFCSFSGWVCFCVFGIIFNSWNFLVIAASFLPQQSQLYRHKSMSISKTGSMKVNLDIGTNIRRRYWELKEVNSSARSCEHWLLEVRVSSALTSSIGWCPKAPRYW